MEKKKKQIFLCCISCLISILLIISCLIVGLNVVVPAIIDNLLSPPYEKEKYNSVEDAIYAMESYERELNDSSLDYCPPYEIKFKFNYEDNTFVVYSYCYSFDGNPATNEYAIETFKHNKDGTVSFNDSFANFKSYENDVFLDYYYFTNIETNKGTKSICFLYLPKDSDKTIYYDGIETEKQLVSIDGTEFYICYAVSKKDTLISNMVTPISERHKVEIK